MARVIAIGQPANDSEREAVAYLRDPRAATVEGHSVMSETPVGPGRSLATVRRLRFLDAPRRVLLPRAAGLNANPPWRFSARSCSKAQNRKYVMRILAVCGVLPPVRNVGDLRGDA